MSALKRFYEESLLFKLVQLIFILMYSLDYLFLEIVIEVILSLDLSLVLIWLLLKFRLVHLSYLILQILY
jgi:hypothetical protein